MQTPTHWHRALPGENKGFRVDPMTVINCSSFFGLLNPEAVIISISPAGCVTTTTHASRLISFIHFLILYILEQATNTLRYNATVAMLLTEQATRILVLFVFFIRFILQTVQMPLFVLSSVCLPPQPPTSRHANSGGKKAIQL